METESEQQLIEWVPLPEVSGNTPSFGDIAMQSSNHQTLIVTLPYEEGTLMIEFKDVRAFMTTWDGDPNSVLTFEEAALRPGDLFRIETSRWLSETYFFLDSESSIQTSEQPWQHFCSMSGQRSLHVAARDSIEASWTAE